MVKHFTVTFPSNDEFTERTAYIYLPASYKQTKRKRYPVLYMFDGHNVFFDEDATYGKCWGLKEYMDRTKTQMIIAAVECNHSPKHGRLKEYSPFSFSDPEFGIIQGLGKSTMDWFVNEFKPFVDSNYRTLRTREHTFIAGSSMGGLMSVYALLEYNSVFSRAAALSPSLWVSPEQIRNLITSSRLDPDTILYMDYGSDEFGNHSNLKKAFGEIATHMMRHNILLDCRIVPGGTHCEACWERQLPFFMHTLTYKYK